MASNELPVGAFNGNDKSNPDIIVTTRHDLTDDVIFRVNGDTYRSPTRDIPPAFVQGDFDVGNGGSESVTNINKLDFFSRDPRIAKAPYCITQVDIIGVPAIGGHAENTWMSNAVFTPTELGPVTRSSDTVMAMIRNIPIPPTYSVNSPILPHTSTSQRLERKEPVWITRGIRSRNNEARVLLYDHGETVEGVTLKTLAARLLRNIEDLRRIEREARPLFFVCHSTGGLVLKMALAKAQRSKNPILGDVYGVTFFSTPHRGSSYLSRPEFSYKVAEIMKWSAPLPETISEQLSLDHPLLRVLDSDFKSLATEFQVWSFFETEDTDLSNEFHAPITSIKSALLNLRHEVVYPLLSDHANCASFGINNQQTKESYLGDLSEAITKALELNNTKHTEMNLEDRVKVEINGFYELSDGEASMKVWSTSRSINDFKRHGPAKLLVDRLSEINAPPKEKQYIRANTRSSNFQASKRKETASTVSVPPSTSKNSVSPGLGTKTRKFLTGKNKDKGTQENKPSQDLASQGPEVPSIAIVADDDNLSSRPLPNASTPSAVPSEKALNITSNSRPNFDSSQAVAKPSNDLGNLSPVRRSRTGQSKKSAESPDLLRAHNTRRDTSSSARRASDATINTSVLPPAFSRPDVSKQKLVWIHVPFNNPIWVKDVLSTISIDKGRDCNSRLLSPDNWESKHVRGRHAEHHACFLKPGCALITPEANKPMSPLSSHRKQLGIAPAHVQMYLYLPYLHFDSYKALVKRRALIKRRIKQGRSRPVPQSVAKLDSLESKVIWQYLGHDPPLNCRRTLDQFGYPSLLDTRARDDDQMLYKMTKQRFAHSDEIFANKIEERERLAEIERNEKDDNVPYDRSDFEEEEEEEESEPEEDENDVLDGNVLMVDQLWLWIVDSATTVTFFPRKEPLVTDGRLFQQADLRNSIFNEVNADLTSRCENSFDLAALVTLHAVEVLFERSSHPDLEIFRTFEEAISILTEKMTTSFKKFRARGFRDKMTDDNDNLRAHNIRARHKREGALAERQNRENTSALLELRDIEDELHTLEELFDTQGKAIDLMKKNFEKEELKSMTANGLIFLAQAEDRLHEYTSQIRRMIDDVKATREDFDKLLQMIQRQAQVDEVRLQRLQADLASAQSRSVMIFTIFTVIFLPLTFFTGLFGMNTLEWGGQDGQFLPLREIGAISLPSSFLIIAITLVLAWSTRTRKLFNRIVRSVNKGGIAIRKSIITFLFYIPAAATLASKESRKKRLEERREAKRLKKEEKRQASWFDEDFWESHVAARDKDYTVPPQNRKSVSLARMKRLEEAEMKGKFNFYARGLGLGASLGKEKDPFAKEKI